MIKMESEQLVSQILTVVSKYEKKDVGLCTNPDPVLNINCLHINNINNAYSYIHDTLS